MAGCHVPYFALPGWYTQTFEEMYSANGTAGLFPNLGPSEMNLLTSVLQILQQKIFMNKSTSSLNIDIHESDIIDSCSSNRKNFATVAARFLQSLPAFCISNTKPTSEVLKLFDDFSWQKTDEGLNLQLKLNSKASEICMGFNNPVQELLRGYRKEKTLNSSVSANSPLLFGKSVWLELNPTEQLIFLKMLQSSQWHQQFVSLNGMTYTSCEELLKTVPLETKTLKKSSTPFLAFLKVIKRMSQKLIDHGVISPPKDLSYLVFQKDSSLSLMWQPHTNSHVKDYRGSYLHEVHNTFIHHTFQQRSHEWIRLFTGGNTQEQTLQKVWGDYELLLPIAEESPYFYIDKHQMIPYLFLYLEWKLRTQFKPLKIPHGLSRITALKDIHTTEDVSKHFESFCHYFNKNPSMLHRILNEDHASLLVYSSQKTEIHKEYIAQLRKPALQTSSTKPRVNKIRSEDKKLQPTEEALPTKPAEPSQAKKQGAVSANLIRVAAEELSRLKRFDYHSYADLKSSYKDTLDVTAKKLIDELEQRMLPDMFDDQIRDRLVQFMTKNPQLWKAAGKKPGARRRFE